MTWTGLTAVSLFAGVGGFDEAARRAGVDVVAAVEIDPDCRGVLARHFPDVKLFSDVREVTGDDLRAAGFVPGRGIITAGWPCQGNSVAGRRGGMGDPRSGLWRHVVRLLAETSARWFVGENVPGLYSVNGGADIAVVRSDLARLGYWWAERILDSQHFGVAQRRARVFFVGHLGGSGAEPVEVLLEPEGGTGNPAQGGTAGQDAAGSAPVGTGSTGTVGTLGGTGPGGGWRVGADEAAAGQLIADAITPGCHWRGTSGNPAEDGHLIVTAATLQGGGRRGHRIDAEGAAGGHLIPFDTAQITSGENRANPRPGDPAPPLNQSGQVHVADTAYALTARNDRNDREDNYVAYPVAVRGREGGSQIECGDPAFTLRTPAGGSSWPMVAHALTSEGADASEDGTGRGTPLVVAATLTSGRAAGDGVSDPGRRREDDVNLLPMAFKPDVGTGEIGYREDAGALTRTTATAVRTGTAVRRLTPMECERLQALPDEWTRWKLVNGLLVEQSDSARYREIGNAVTVTVPEWIIRRVVAADQRRETGYACPLPSAAEGAA